MPIATTGLPLGQPADQFHTSTLLQDLVDGIAGEYFTLDWLIGRLPRHSFGIIMLLLSLLSLVPVVSIVSRLLILVLACQIILGYDSPVLPRRLLHRRLPSRYLTRLNRHAIPTLRHIERTVRPRWPLLLKIRRPTAFIAFFLTILSLLAPLPFANVPPAIVSMLIALAYIEHDGLLLAAALGSALIMLGATLVLIL